MTFAASCVTMAEMPNGDEAARDFWESCVRNALINNTAKEWTAEEIADFADELLKRWYERPGPDFSGIAGAK